MHAPCGVKKRCSVMDQRLTPLEDVGATIGIVALGLVCCAQYTWFWWRARSWKKSLDHIGGQLTEALTARANAEIERWLCGFERDLWRGLCDAESRLAWESLLNHLMPRASSAFAMVLREERGNTVVVASQHVSSTEEAQVLVGRSLWHALQTKSAARLDARAIAQRDRIGLPASLAQRADSVWVLRIGAAGDPGWALLVSARAEETQALPAALLDSVVERLSRVPHPTRQMESLSTAPDDLRLVREMLELRSLADLSFSTPVELVQAFLSRLSTMASFDRGSLYLLDDSNERGFQIFARGGDPLSHRANADWIRCEDRIVHAHIAHTSPVVLTTEGLKTYDLDPPFRAGLILPLSRQGMLLGHLCFTGDALPATASPEIELIEWGGDYLLETMIRTLDRMNVEVEARRDGLTQLANRQTFDRTIAQTLDRSDAYQPSCVLILLDLDRFKLVNDTYGHLAGDYVLRRVSEIISQTVRQTRQQDEPLAARFGGEELAVLLPHCDIGAARRIAETIRKAVRETEFIYEGEMIPVTLSAGIACSAQHGTTPRDLIAAADEALYSAKRAGRDRIEVARSFEVSRAGIG